SGRQGVELHAATVRRSRSLAPAAERERSASRRRGQREMSSIVRRPGAEMVGLRLAFSIALLLCGLFNAVTVAAQQAAKVARIGWLGFERPGAPRYEAFLQGLRDLGYVEGS